MSFEPAGSEIGRAGSGEIIGQTGVVSAYTNFEDGLVAGRFCKYIAGTDTVENVDGSATPIIGGVVKRSVTNAIEDGSAYTHENTNILDVVESGIVTVDTVAGLTIQKFQPVKVSNLGDADDGKAHNATGVDVDGYFYEEVNTDVWSVRLK